MEKKITSTKRLYWHRKIYSGNIMPYHEEYEAYNSKKQLLGRLELDKETKKWIWYKEKNVNINKANLHDVKGMQDILNKQND